MPYLCRDCGNKVKINLMTNTAHCYYCNKELTKKETISSWNLKARVNQLKAMHELMCNSNDEEIYYSWIVTGVPDEPSEEDFEYIAMDDDSYNECWDLFVKLVKYNGNRW